MSLDTRNSNKVNSFLMVQPICRLIYVKEEFGCVLICQYKVNFTKIELFCRVEFFAIHYFQIVVQVIFSAKMLILHSML